MELFACCTSVLTTAAGPLNSTMDVGHHYKGKQEEGRTTPKNLRWEQQADTK